MATKNVTIPKSYKGLKAVYITPSEEGLLRRTSHPKGSPQPKKGPGGLLMMDGEEMRDRDFAKKHGLTYKEVNAAGGATSRKAASLAAAKKSAPKKSAPKKSAPKKEAPRKSAAPAPASWGGTEDSPDTRMGYDPSGSVDYTNTNPAYWASAVRYFKAHPEGNPNTGELGIWIPNLEKEGAERTALAAIAGGVTAHVDSNYSNRTVDDAKAKALHAARGDAAGAAGSYRGGAEKAIRLAGTHRGGVLTDTGYAMGSTAPSEHGVHIKGGKVVKDAGGDYVKGGGDFGGLLSRGDTITGDWLTGVLGPMDSDGMRIGGTYPTVKGATGFGAGGTKTSIGGLYSGGADPFAKMPGVADYTAYMDPNSIFGGLSDNAAVKSGLLYQPTASDYGAKMEAAGMPSFSPGLLDSFSGAGAPTYSSAPGGFMKPATGGTTTGSGSKIIGDPAAKYDIPDMLWGYKSSLIPRFASKAEMDKYSHSDVYGGVGPYKGYSGTVGVKPMGAFVGGDLYEMVGGGGDGWSLHASYPAVT